LKRRGERIGWGIAAAFLAAGIAAKTLRGEPVDGDRASMYFPMGLLILTAVNGRLRSKVLAWAVFTLALVVGMIVFGAGIVTYRASMGFSAANVGAATLLYAALATAAGFQLRVEGAPARNAERDRAKTNSN